MSVVEISSLTIYPVKSTAGVSLQQMELSPMGPQWDRRWMVVAANYQFLTQRQYPAMCKINSRLSEGDLLLTAAGKTELRLDSRDYGPPLPVTVWRDQVMAQDCGDRAAAWLSEMLATPCRLVFMPEQCQRRVDPQYSDGKAVVSFADGFPLLLISEASLEALNQQLPKAISMARFRPNIVVRGCEAFAEDRWRRIQIAGIEFSVAKPCSRCIIPALDPVTGERNPEVLKGLQSFRRQGQQVLFGQNLLHHGVGRLVLGDGLTVLS